MSIKRLLVLLLAVISISFIFHGCGEDKDPDPDRGELISTKIVASLPASTINNMFAELLNGSELEYSIDAHKIVYNTIDTDGNPTPASGMMIVPADLISAPVLVLNHGTVTKRTDVASEKLIESFEGVMGILTAATGYIVILPDYLGFGESELNHPYIHAKSLATAIVDCMRGAGRLSADISIDWNGKLFLAGYSEGGYATLAAHREIEEFHSDEFNLTAVVPMAGPYDLRGMVDSTFADQYYSSSIYPAFILSSSNRIYGWHRMAVFFNSP